MIKKIIGSFLIASPFIALGAWCALSGLFTIFLISAGITFIICIVVSGGVHLFFN